ncbi:MAG: hypothetical protein DRP87_02960 [Spirochaetes bacterium]|nr:MAG: hypothetical protein DRP87_02960 [Spirochaetota bacterium]
MKWERQRITTDFGNETEALSPVIITASRSTDIPSFFGDWLIDRFKRKYLKWYNPFNGQPYYVSLEKVRFIVFWTKEPHPNFMKNLIFYDNLGINYYIQYTLNDYESDNLEPNLAPIENRIEKFKQLSEKIGSDRIIWRFDPLVLTEEIGTDRLLEKIYRIGNRIAGYTEKLVISFADIEKYRKVKKNMLREGIPWRKWDLHSIRRIASEITYLARKWELTTATCCEKVDLEEYGIIHNRCVDPHLISRIASGDPEIEKFILKNGSKKDTGQREACGCIPSKDIGQYNTCPNLCTYCYANSSPEVVKKNLTKSLSTSESIC